MELVAWACSKKKPMPWGFKLIYSEFATVDGQDPANQLQLGWLNFRDNGILMILTDQQLEGILSHSSQLQVGGRETYRHVAARPLNISTTLKKQAQLYRAPMLPKKKNIPENHAATLEQWRSTQAIPRP